MSQNCRHICIFIYIYLSSNTCTQYIHILCALNLLEYNYYTWNMNHFVTSCPFLSPPSCPRCPRSATPKLSASEVRNHHPRNLEVASFLAAQCGTHRPAFRLGWVKVNPTKTTKRKERGKDGEKAFIRESGAKLKKKVSNGGEVTGEFGWKWLNSTIMHYSSTTELTADELTREVCRHLNRLNHHHHHHHQWQYQYQYLSIKCDVSQLLQSGFLFTINTLMLENKLLLVSINFAGMTSWRYIPKYMYIRSPCFCRISSHHPIATESKEVFTHPSLRGVWTEASAAAFWLKGDGNRGRCVVTWDHYGEGSIFIGYMNIYIYIHYCTFWNTLYYISPWSLT